MNWNWCKKITATLLSCIYPENIYCISCGDFIEQDKAYSLCDNCMKKMHWITENRCCICGKEILDEQELCQDCQVNVRQFDYGMSCVQYGRMEKKLIHRFKYKDCGYMGRPMGLLMAERLVAESSVVSVLNEIGLVVAVPMYKGKQRIRGYNQAEVLAQEVALRLGLPYCKNLLQRTRDTAPMNALHAEQRRENVKEAFQIAEKYREKLDNCIALLVDDVYTTGSTADACAEVLKREGAQGVFVLAFASGVDRQGERACVVPSGNSRLQKENKAE